MAGMSNKLLTEATLKTFAEAHAAVHRGDTGNAVGLLQTLWTSTAGHGGSLDETVEHALIGIAAVTQGVLMAIGEEADLVHGRGDATVFVPRLIAVVQQSTRIDAFARGVVQGAASNRRIEALVIAWSDSMCVSDLAPGLTRHRTEALFLATLLRTRELRAVGFREVTNAMSRIIAQFRQRDHIVGATEQACDTLQQAMCASARTVWVHARCPLIAACVDDNKKTQQIKDAVEAIHEDFAVRREDSPETYRGALAAAGHLGQLRRQLKAQSPALATQPVVTMMTDRGGAIHRAGEAFEAAALEAFEQLEKENERHDLQAVAKEIDHGKHLRAHQQRL